MGDLESPLFATVVQQTRKSPAEVYYTGISLPFTKLCAHCETVSQTYLSPREEEEKGEEEREGRAGARTNYNKERREIVHRALQM